MGSDGVSTIGMIGVFTKHVLKEATEFFLELNGRAIHDWHLNSQVMINLNSNKILTIPSLKNYINYLLTQ